MKIPKILYINLFRCIPENFQEKICTKYHERHEIHPNKINQHILCVKLYTSESEGITHMTHKLSLTYKTTIVDSVVPQLHPIWSLSTQDYSFSVLQECTPISRLQGNMQVPLIQQVAQLVRAPAFQHTSVVKLVDLNTVAVH